MSSYVDHCQSCRKPFYTFRDNPNRFCSETCKQTGPRFRNEAKENLVLDVKALLDGLGPKIELAKFCGVARTAPYGWATRNQLNSDLLAKVVEYARSKRGVKLDLNRFFVEGGRK